jgi:hypothetical protein
MADEDELGVYTVTEEDGTERQYQLTAKQAKERGGVAVETKQKTPDNKAVTPENKTKG